MSQKKRLLVLASGRGSNFQAIAKEVLSGNLPFFELIGLVSNRPEAPALKLAQEFKTPTYLIDSKHYFQDPHLGRQAYNKALRDLLICLRPDVIALAGYMLVLDADTVEQFPGKILNIHPSLLPKYPGLHPQQKALEAGDLETGCTVHWVTSELDAGPILIQKRLPILPEDTEKSLIERLLPLEHQTYLEALKLFTHSVDDPKKKALREGN